MRLGNVICRDLDLSRPALIAAVSHGQVALDSRVLTKDDLNTQIEDVAPGALVRFYGRMATVNGSRLAQPVEQLELEFNAIVT